MRRSRKDARRESQMSLTLLFISVRFPFSQQKASLGFPSDMALRFGGGHVYNRKSTLRCSTYRLLSRVVLFFLMHLSHSFLRSGHGADPMILCNVGAIAVEMPGESTGIKVAGAQQTHAVCKMDMACRRPSTELPVKQEQNDRGRVLRAWLRMHSQKKIKITPLPPPAARSSARYGSDHLPNHLLVDIQCLHFTVQAHVNHQSDTSIQSSGLPKRSYIIHGLKLLANCVCTKGHTAFSFVTSGHLISSSWSLKNLGIH